MSAPPAPAPAPTQDENVAKPLLRDPPAPPGYVDPLSGNPTLENLGAQTGTASPFPEARPSSLG